MPNLNKIFLIGNLTNDPELRQTDSQTAVANFGLAVNRRVSKDSEHQENVCFVDIVVFSKLAEACAKYLNKGKSVFVEGRLQLRTWEQEEQTRNKLEVVAQNIQFLSPHNAKL